MKILKDKIKQELLLLENKVAANEKQVLSRDTLETAYKLATTFVYLHKACDIMEGRQDVKYDTRTIAAL